MENQFIIAAMQGLLAHYGSSIDPKELAIKAIEIANAMDKALENEDKKNYKYVNR